MGPAHVDSVLHFSAKYMFVSLHTCKAVRSSLRQAQRTLVLMVHAFSILCGLYLLFRVLCVPAQPSVVDRKQLVAELPAAQHPRALLCQVGTPPTKVGHRHRLGQTDAPARFASGQLAWVRQVILAQPRHCCPTVVSLSAWCALESCSYVYCYYSMRLRGALWTPLSMDLKRLVVESALCGSAPTGFAFPNEHNSNKGPTSTLHWTSRCLPRVSGSWSRRPPGSE